MGNSFRSQPFPTRYGPAQSPVTVDYQQVGLPFAFGIIAVSFIAIIPGIRGWERLWATIRVFVALWIGAILLVCNFGSWYADSICTRTQYKAHTRPNTPQEIQATVGISIGLRGFNVTLIEMEDGCGEEDYEPPFPNEQIHYVERFHWAPSWRQGRLDYGEFGEQFRMRYHKALERGMPYPILWVVESFMLDGEQFRWFRKFRVAGWYTHIFMWTSFATYLLSIVLFVINIRRGAYFMFLTGILMCLAALAYSVIVQNDPPFKIRFADGVLKPNFNYAFYLTLVTGGLTVVAACVVIFLDLFFPRKVAAFFHHAIIEDDTIFEGLLEDEEEEDVSLPRKRKISYSQDGGRRRKSHFSRKSTISHHQEDRGDLRRRSNVLVRESSIGHQSSRGRASMSAEVEVELEMLPVREEGEPEEAQAGEV